MQLNKTTFFVDFGVLSGMYAFILARFRCLVVVMGFYALTKQGGVHAARYLLICLHSKHSAFTYHELS